MPRTTRRIGRIGTVSRVLVGLALLSLAFADGGTWGLAWHEALLGLVAFPAAMGALGLGARLLGVGAVRFDGPVGIAANTGVIVALVVIDYTAAAAALFYGTTLLVAAWRGQPGCEATVLSNWILGRDDQIGCPTFTLIDGAEAHLAARDRDSRQRQGELAPADLHGAATFGDLAIVHLAVCCGVAVVAGLAFALISQLS